MNAERLKSYTVDDLIKYGYVSKIIVKHDPYPINCMLCPYDFYSFKGMLQSGCDMKGELEEILDNLKGKSFQEQMMICMKHLGGKADPNKVKDFLNEI